MSQTLWARPYGGRVKHAWRIPQGYTHHEALCDYKLRIGGGKSDKPDDHKCAYCESKLAKMR